MKKIKGFWDAHSFGLMICTIFALVPLFLGVIIYIIVSPITPIERLITLVVICIIGFIWDVIVLAIIVNS